MADIRINSLSTTASSTASDDFLAVDGTTNGTRKLNAYSPTFGGNLTVSGTGTLGAAKAGTGIAGFAEFSNSSVFGTGGYALAQNSSGASFLNAATGQDVQIRTNGATLVATFNAAGLTKLEGNLTVSGTGTSSVNGTLLITGTTNYTRIRRDDTVIDFTNAAQSAYADAQIVANNLYLKGNNGTGAYINASGNVLIGTTTDSSNGKLQLTSHTTSAGGIGFGTDWGIYRKSQYTLGLNVASGAKPLFVYTDVTNVGFFDQADVNTTTGWSGYYITPGDKALKLATNNTTALTLDSSQNATFAGTVNVGTGTSNSSYQNIYTNKSENTAGPVSITLPANCTGTVRVSSYQSGVGRSFRTIPFLNFGGTVTLGTSDTTVVTADPVTSVAAGTGAVTLNLVAANTNVYWGIDVVKA